VKVAVLASGSGTILEAMLEAGVPVGLVAVDRPCRATSVAQVNGIETAELLRISWDASFDREAYTRAVVVELERHGIDLVVMAGFGTILEKPVYDRYAGWIVNTHPSLLPSFPGWHAVEAALNYGVKVSGCTVHVAEREVDSGPILAQQAVVVEPGDTTSTLHERIKEVERELYVDTVQDILKRGFVLDAEQRGSPT